jgi:hypothetical protein
MWINMVQPDRPQMATKYDAGKMQSACQITDARIQTHTDNI